MTLFDNSFYKSNFYLVQTKSYHSLLITFNIKMFNKVIFQRLAFSVCIMVFKIKEYLVSLHIEDATFVDDEIIDFFNYFKIEFQAPPIALKSTPLLLNPPCGRLTFMTLRQKLSLLFTT